MELDTPSLTVLEGRVLSRPAAYPTAFVSRWNSTLPASRSWKAGFHPGQRRIRQPMCRDETQHSQPHGPGRPGSIPASGVSDSLCVEMKLDTPSLTVLEGRVPSRPAVYPTAFVSRWNSTLPASRPWKAGFYPGQRRIRQPMCRDETQHSQPRGPGRPGSIPASGVSDWRDTLRYRRVHVIAIMGFSSHFQISLLSRSQEHC